MNCFLRFTFDFIRVRISFQLVNVNYRCFNKFAFECPFVTGLERLSCIGVCYRKKGRWDSCACVLVIDDSKRRLAACCRCHLFTERTKNVIDSPPTAPSIATTTNKIQNKHRRWRRSNVFFYCVVRNNPFN